MGGPVFGVWCQQSRVAGYLPGRTHDMMGCLIKIINILIDALFDHKDCRAIEDLMQFID